MRKVLHIGPETCSVISNLLKEDDIEAWGVEPYDLEDADTSCKILVRKGIVRVADIKFPLPYRAKSFSLVIVSDALDYLSPKYLNKTLPDLARVSTDGLVIFAGSFLGCLVLLLIFSSSGTIKIVCAVADMNNTLCSFIVIKIMRSLLTPETYKSFKNMT